MFQQTPTSFYATTNSRLQSDSIETGISKSIWCTKCKYVFKTNQSARNCTSCITSGLITDFYQCVNCPHMLCKSCGDKAETTINEENKQLQKYWNKNSDFDEYVPSKADECDSEDMDVKPSFSKTKNAVKKGKKRKLKSSNVNSKKKHNYGDGNKRKKKKK
eukprot:383039_1